MAETVFYGPIPLPSGKQVKFRRPTGLDRLNVMQSTSIGQDDVVSGTLIVQTYLAAKVVTEVDNKPVDGNFKTLFNSWDDADVQYFTSLNAAMFGLTADKEQEIKDKAAFLLGNLTSTDGSSSQNSATAQLSSGSPAVTN